MLFLLSTVDDQLIISLTTYYTKCLRTSLVYNAGYTIDYRRPTSFTLDKHITRSVYVIRKCTMLLLLSIIDDQLLTRLTNLLQGVFT